MSDMVVFWEPIGLFIPMNETDIVVLSDFYTTAPGPQPLCMGGVSSAMNHLSFPLQQFKKKVGANLASPQAVSYGSI